MKYYLYISDAKVDMLLPQVPHETKKKIAIDFGMDIKIFRAGRKSEEETEENRVTRLEAVVTFIREFGNVGTVDDPDEYIDDTQPVWWGPLENMAYFSGKTEKTTFALAGSARHLLGAMPDQDVWPFSSQLSGIMGWLEKEDRDLEAAHAYTNADNSKRKYDLETESKVLSHVYALAAHAESAQGPQQRLDFLAKRLIFDAHCRDWYGQQTRILLATPLYVAMTD